MNASSTEENGRWRGAPFDLSDGGLRTGVRGTCLWSPVGGIGGRHLRRLHKNLRTKTPWLDEQGGRIITRSRKPGREGVAGKKLMYQGGGSGKIDKWKKKATLYLERL